MFYNALFLLIPKHFKNWCLVIFIICSNAIAKRGDQMKEVQIKQDRKDIKIGDFIDIKKMKVKSISNMLGKVNPVFNISYNRILLVLSLIPLQFLIEKYIKQIKLTDSVTISILGTASVDKYEESMLSR